MASTLTSRRTASTPFLSFEPVNYSLTDGTNIPPPPPYQPPLPIKTRHTSHHTTPPQTAHSRKSSLLDFGGPLSSHPITPVDSQGSDIIQKQEMSGSTNDTHSSHPTQSLYGPSHVSTTSSDVNNFDPSPSTNHLAKDTSRRPSFVARIMRLRTSSFMRSKSSLGTYTDSTTSLNARDRERPETLSANGLQQVREADRGLKRPATPDASNSSTFPRIIRKKSLDLLSTARRKSGMWSGNSDMYKSAVDDERTREEARERYANGDRESVDKPTLPQRSETPPPAVEVSGLDGGSFMNTEDMFKGIGKD